MASFFSSLLTFVLVCTSVFVIFVILMQKPSANAGMGSSLGGGVVENAFGSDTVKVLTGWTIKGIVTFFIVAFTLSMLQIHRHTHKKSMHYNIDINNITEEQSSVPMETTKE